MRVPRRLRIAALALPLALVMAAGAGAGAASTPAPVKPGTPKQVAQLVAAARSIKKLPLDLTPSITFAPQDQPETYFPALTDCVTNNVTAPSCVFGDVNGTKTMVLFGDSHAYMWFSALDEIAIAAKWKLVALLDYGCPVADVTVWNTVNKAPDTGCPSHRKAMIERINKLNPNLVVMAEKFVTLDAKRQTITDSEWESALEKSLAALHSPSMKKVLIGNTMQIENMFTCLEANPSDIQRCSVSEDNPAAIGQRAAEMAAAAAKKVHYIDEIPWLCSTTCTVVIGHFIAYDSPGHLSNTYALYLAGVLKQALRPYM